MNKSNNNPPDTEKVTSDIVRIAYRQSRELAGSEISDELGSKSSKEGFACTQRLTNLPIVASLNSCISEAYTSVKQSNSTVDTIFTKTEEGLNEGMKKVAPVTSRIGKSFEEPLKTIDNAICHGLDYLEDNVPSVKLPPAEIYGNLEGYVRNVSDNVKKHSTELYTDMKVKLDELTKAMQAELEDTASKNDSKDRSRKSDDSS